MKKTSIHYIYVFMAIFYCLLYHSCNPCSTKDCGSHGNCIGEGECECEQGWGMNVEGKCEVKLGDVSLGFLSGENTDTIPQSFSAGAFGATGNLPSSVDLQPYFPPIKDQSPYGTCVAWSVGYYLKTSMDAIDGGWNQSQLNNTSYQYSPADLFTAIPNSSKGTNCNGTYGQDALNTMQSRGIATWAIAPYTQIGNCNSNTVPANWTQDAANHKIMQYQTVQKSVEEIKAKLANDQPVAFAMQIYANFQQTAPNSVLNYNSGAKLGGHAMTIAGYDDNKGANGAFKVVNSWGTTFCDKGVIWMDYNYLVTNAEYLYIIVNQKSPNPPNPTPAGNGGDLASYIYDDVSTYNTTGYTNSRTAAFNLYNIGSASVSPNPNWVLAYLYYNAYDNDDYDVLFYDEFTTSIPANTVDCSGNGVDCTLNYAIPASSNLSKVLFGNDNGIIQDYFVPQITGNYYLILLADAGGVIDEDNEENNLFYIDYPRYFNNGYAAKTTQPNHVIDFYNPNKPSTEFLQKNKYQTAVNARYPNAYRPEEIMAFIKAKKKSGELDAKVAQWKNKHPNHKGIMNRQ